MKDPQTTSIWKRQFFPELSITRFFRWLFSWRMIRRYIFCLACLATLVAVFYAEENWRGKHAWNKYRRESEANGVSLDWKQYVPAMVPDDQNFAMVPLLRPLFDYDAKLPSIWRDTNGLRRVQDIGLNYIWTTPRPKTPEFGDFTKGLAINLKEWQDNFRTAKYPTNRVGGPTTNLWPRAAKPQTPAADVLLALTKFDSELKELYLASTRPYSRFPIHYDDNQGALLAHLATLMGISQVVTMRAVAELDLGKRAEAFQDAKFALFLADSIKSEPFRISQTVRIRLLNIALQSIWQGLANHQWAESEIAEFQRILGRNDFLRDYRRISNAETAFQVSWIEAVSNRPEAFDFMDTGTAVSPPMKLLLHLFPSGWYNQNKACAGKFSFERVLPLIDPVARRAFPDLSRTNRALLVNSSITPFTFFVRSLPVGFNPGNFAYGQTQSDLARIACALERYRLMNGHFPETLEVLAPKFIDELPRDIINGQPLKYHLRGNDQFILYSVGWDQRDDGGKFRSVRPEPNNNNGNNWKYDEPEDGDWVWSYPAK